MFRESVSSWVGGHHKKDYQLWWLLYWDHCANFFDLKHLRKSNKNPCFFPNIKITVKITNIEQWWKIRALPVYLHDFSSQLFISLWINFSKKKGCRVQLIKLPALFADGFVIFIQANKSIYNWSCDEWVERGGIRRVSQLKALQSFNRFRSCWVL